MVLLLIGSMKTDVYGQAVFNFVNNQIHLDYLMGAIDIFGLLVAILVVAKNEREREK